ncbi:MAG: O-antigen ligase family protein [Ruminococcus sp.]|nr:O-antigen ligase family protein [Ruminococcus sp.]
MAVLKEKLNDSSLFRTIYIVDLFFCMVSFLQIPAYILLVFLFIWGVRLVYVNQKRYNTFMKLRFGIWIGAFLIVSFVSILINLSVTMLFSVLMFFHVVICFFLFYGMHTESNLDFKEELFGIGRIIIVCTTLFNLVGFFCLLFGINFEWNLTEDYFVRFPIFENRFTGPFYNPNFLGFACVASIFLCHMLSKQSLRGEVKARGFGRVFLYSCMLVNLFGLILCDSNAAFVLMLGYAVTYLVYIFFDTREGLTPAKVFIKIITLLIICTVFVGSSMLFRTVFKAGFAAVTAKTNALVDVLFHEEELMNEIADGELEQENNEAVTFNHENTNIDSGRFRLWRESLDLFKISPVIGIANGNIVFYSEEYLNGALQFSYHNNDPHNGYLTILVSTGVIGALLFGTFGFRFAKHAAQHLFLRRKTVRKEIYPCLFSFLVGYMGYAFFEKALLYDISFLVMFFWLIMGYISCYVAKYEHLIETQYLFHQKRIRRTML